MVPVVAAGGGPGQLDEEVLDFFLRAVLQEGEIGFYRFAPAGQEFGDAFLQVDGALRENVDDGGDRGLDAEFDDGVDDHKADRGVLLLLQGPYQGSARSAGGEDGQGGGGFFAAEGEGGMEPADIDEVGPVPEEVAADSQTTVLGDIQGLVQFPVGFQEQAGLPAVDGGR